MTQPDVDKYISILKKLCESTMDKQIYTNKYFLHFLFFMTLGTLSSSAVCYYPGEHHH